MAVSEGVQLEVFCGPNCPCRDPLTAQNGEAATRRRLHLLGHMIDWRAGEGPDGSSTGIPQDGIEDELLYVFNDLTNGALNEARRTRPNLTEDDSPAFRGATPADWGCYGEEAKAELMAEAIRAYLQDPNYIKTVAPNTARRIRDFWNSKEHLARLLHFN